MNAIWIWLGIAALCVVAEVLTVNFVFFMLAVGAGAAAVAALAGLGAPWQVLIAAIVAAAGLLLARPFMLRHLRPQAAGTATNVDAMIGKSALAKEVVTSTSGTASVNGEIWSARVPDGAAPIPHGQPGRIDRIDGVYLILSPAIGPPPPQNLPS